MQIQYRICVRLQNSIQAVQSYRRILCYVNLFRPQQKGTQVPLRPCQKQKQKVLKSFHKTGYAIRPTETAVFLALHTGSKSRSPTSVTNSLDHNLETAEQASCVTKRLILRRQNPTIRCQDSSNKRARYQHSHARLHSSTHHLFSQLTFIKFLKLIKTTFSA